MTCKRLESPCWLLDRQQNNLISYLRIRTGRWPNWSSVCYRAEGFWCFGLQGYHGNSPEVKDKEFKDLMKMMKSLKTVMMMMKITMMKIMMMMMKISCFSLHAVLWWFWHEASCLLVFMVSCERVWIQTDSSVNMNSWKLQWRRCSWTRCKWVHHCIFSTE